MPINLGSGAIAKAYIGSTQVSQIYLGATPLLSPSSPTTPYDDAIAIYSVRRVLPGYSGNLIQGRKGGATQNFGTGNPEVTTTEVGAYAAPGDDVFVPTWYDQSGNGNNLTQATDSSQPQIATAGTAEAIGTKLAIRFLVDIRTMLAVLPETNVAEVYIVFINDSVAPKRRDLAHLYRDGQITGMRVGLFGGQTAFGAVYFVDPTGSDDLNLNLGGDFQSQCFGIAVFKDGSQFVRADAGAQSLSGTGAFTLRNQANELNLNRIVIGDDNTGGNESVSRIQEIIVFPTERSPAQRDTIIADQKAYFL